VVSHTVDGELLAADENRGGLHVSALDVNDAESLLPVRGTALEVLGLFHVHQVPDLHAGQDSGLARVADRVTGDAQTVGVTHDEARVQLLRRVTGRPARNRVQPDTATVPVSGDPARSNLVEFRQLPDLVVVELKQLIHVESVRLGQCRGVLAQVEPWTLIVIALVEPDLTSVHLAEGLNQVPDRVLGVLEHRSLKLGPCSLGPSRRLRVVDYISNMNHLVRLVILDEFNDRLYSPLIFVRHLGIGQHYNASCFTHLPISVHSAFDVFNSLDIEENRSGMVLIGFPVKPLHEVTEGARLSAIQRLLIVELLPVTGLVVGGALGHQPSDSGEVLVLVRDPFRKKQVESGLPVLGVPHPSSLEADPVRLVQLHSSSSSSTATSTSSAWTVHHCPGA